MHNPVKMFLLQALTSVVLVLLHTHSVAAGPGAGSAGEETAPSTVDAVPHAEPHENGSDDPGFKVAWEGALRHFHHGDVSGRVDLRQFSDRPGVIAVGPVGELDGEVTAIDGQWFITRMHDGQPVTTDETKTQAGFLVWADVPAWRDPVEIDATVSSHRELEVLIGDLAEAATLDTDTPFPFRVQAVASSLDWHVLAPPRDGQEQRGHLDSAFKQRLEQVEVELVGFFSRHHAGVFTHRDSWAHIHVILPDGHAGHVDAIELEAGARLLLPR